MIARLLEPSSELYTAEQWYPKTALPGLLGVPADTVDDNRLYRTLDVLLPHKEALEVHLKNRLGRLFKLEYDLLLYDVTSTFFEGRPTSRWLSEATRVISAATASRCVSDWWCHAAACHWATKSSPATPRM